MGQQRVAGSGQGTNSSLPFVVTPAEIDQIPERIASCLAAAERV